MKDMKMSEDQTAYSSGAAQRISNMYNQLRKSEKSVADYVLQNPEKVINSSISEIAQESNVSDATIVRFCKAAGFSGFQDLKVSMARSTSFFNSPTIFENIRKEDNLNTAIEKIYANNIQALNQTFQGLDLDQLQQSVRAINQARMIYLIGVGTSGLVAEYAAYRFTRIGLMTKSFTDSHYIALATALIKPNDVVLTISQSGSTKAVVVALDMIKGTNAISIAITGHPRSPVAKASNLVLRSSVHETPFESGGMPSMLAQLSVVDALMVGASLANFDASIEMIQATTEALKSKKY